MRAVLCPLLVLLTAIACATPRPAGDGEILLPNGATYRGELRNGVLHGRGRMEWRNGSFLEGEFRHGLANGNGHWESRTGYRYEGEFQDGHEHGRGIFTRADGEVYEGEFRDGEFHGHGTLRDPQGSVVYTGKWQNGEMSGEGQFLFADGRVYEGQLREGQLQGEGRMTHPDGSVYEGEFDAGLYHGPGRYQTESGAVFEGQFAEGSFTGQGTWSHADGRSRYEGAFVDWTFQGDGTLEGKGGWRYEGEFADDGFEGRGRWEGADGEVYEGEFSRGKYHGEGTLHFTNGDGEERVAHGFWSRGDYLRGDTDELLPDPALEPEALLFAQAERVDRAVQAIQPSRPGVPEMYFVGFAGWGDQQVFGREVGFAEQVFRDTLGSEGRSLLLVNHPDAIREDAPLATATNLDRALIHLGRRMDPNEDLLFLFLDSHGAPERLAARQGSLPLTDLRSDMLRDMLDRSGIQWRVIVVSACFSGSFVDDLATDQTLVITAAAEDRRSFGCSDEAEFTDFGAAFFRDALPESGTFEEAFELARTRIREQEEHDEIEASSPQIAAGQEIRRQLERWRATLEGAALPAAPAPPAGPPVTARPR